SRVVAVDTDRLVACGMYDDLFVRGPDGWRIQRRTTIPMKVPVRDAAGPQPIRRGAGAPDSAERRERLRAIACRAMVALAEGRFDIADPLFHSDASWWIIGQGTLSHARVRALAEQTESHLAIRRLKIIDTIAEGDRVSVEARGLMAFADGRTYEN